MQAAGKHMLLNSAFWKSHTFKLTDHNLSHQVVVLSEDIPEDFIYLLV